MHPRLPEACWLPSATLLPAPAPARALGLQTSLYFPALCVSGIMQSVYAPLSLASFTEIPVGSIETAVRASE